MSDIQFEIDGIKVAAKEGMTVLDAARQAGIHIPTLCHHEKLEPFGGCRICIVEVEVKGWTKLVVSCVYPVEKNIIVRTRSEKVDRIRKTIIELLMAHAPDSPDLVTLAKEYGAQRDRYEKDPSFCIHCGLCVRYCAEVTKKNAIGFVDRGINKEISFVPQIAAIECNDCKECFPLCPTSYLQAAFVLTQSLSFPSSS
ncbi:MAG: (2Fe-2S)-binding protein [Proteobacteria bacterium]|nr:(2Fe-2S)-binding protein [Pseudomonadota bacterium]MBU1583426.1 (2Fe-2S)-binding protein [Pseudomonadota bacterium]MBU2455864.1 (2Fe-2S)-binding protein [Pseudomonadota bacterium]MBU2630985.1 (2Fe-2S)-binding protein [Pseudomonadota bacterium]